MEIPSRLFDSGRSNIAVVAIGSVYAEQFWLGGIIAVDLNKDAVARGIGDNLESLSMGLPLALLQYKRRRPHQRWEGIYFCSDITISAPNVH
jgi:hypothetical protein